MCMTFVIKGMKEKLEIDSEEITGFKLVLIYMNMRTEYG